MKYFNTYTGVQHQRPESIRPGGLCYIYFTPKENIQTWPSLNPVTGLCEGLFVLHPGKTWYELKLVNSDRSFTEEQQESAAGHFFRQQVAGYAAGNGTSRILSSGTMPYHDYVVIFKDRDGTIRFLGDPDTGASYSNTYSSGDGNTSRKRRYTFAWQSKNPVPIYKANIVIIRNDIISNPPFDQDQSDGGGGSDAGIFTIQFTQQFN